MTTRSTNGVSVAVFIAALILHVIIISSVFLHFSTEIPQSTHTQFIMQGLPQISERPSAPRAAKPEPVKKPIKKKTVVQPKTPALVPAPPIEQLADTVDNAPVESTEAAPFDVDGDTFDTELADGSGTGTGTGAIDFKALILQRIEQKKIYPKAARKRGQEGAVTVSITVLKSGEVVQADIVSPCRYAFLNEAALASVRAASPFPLGDSAPEKINLTLTLIYQLVN
ncbi:energy transducer TonB [Treponema phagedenis]|uniref:Energy transducer TonB n=1 Tax=Treponema phagedenis TaxID=162 RepID=A0A0B7GXL5_TREPH|nr:TonB family protein [Treponema phagedenis]EFW36674.1 TonB-dependent receptor [Treponema phagedenis F0421]NVP24178.1 energy transducer TonB [Treponema phagedenis]QEJ96331.1 energy transducer TonB [Treponema phagedenis]QEJ99262.1 energy transducer TonB [Treponema phagedenis]QEK04833.1 energy transducer TonB [Treponema phagedenis]